VKTILVGGSYMDYQRKTHRQAWYDQGGVLTTRLGITRVPAIVSQEGRRLRIDEVPVQ
jgi:conjugal transfer pilus assembly protein TraW